MDQDMYDAFRKIGRDGMGVELTNEQIDEINARILERLEALHPFRYCYTCKTACAKWKDCPNFNGGDHNE